MTPKQEAIRKLALEAMKRAFYDAQLKDLSWRECMDAAFDALHGIVLVVPPRPTKEMEIAGSDSGSWEDTVAAMITAGDLTRAGDD